MAGLTYSHQHTTPGGLIDWVEMPLTRVGADLVCRCPVCGREQVPGRPVGQDVEASPRVGPAPEPAASEPVSTLIDAPSLGSDPGYLQVGCAIACASALIGDVLGTAALLLVHPDWLIREGDAVVATAVDLALGWALSFVVAVTCSLILVGVGLMSILERVPRLRPSVPGVFAGSMLVVPACIAAITLWWAASVNG